MDASRLADGSDAGDEPALALPGKATTEQCVSDVLVGVEIPPGTLTLQEEIGWGVTAKVYKGLHEGRVVAVKHFRDPRSMQDKYFAREVETLRRLRHSNIVRLWGLCQSPKGMQLVTEFCQGGTLFELLHESDVNINLSQQCKMASDTATGMRYLHEHSPPIVHRDLKSLNLLLKQPVIGHEDVPVVQVADFGVSRIVEPGQSSDLTMTKGVGTMQWMAPECISSWAYDMTVDVYSYGVCLYEIMAREPPYEELDDHTDINSYVVGGGRPNLDDIRDRTPKRILKLMQQCWAEDHRRRPDFAQICRRLERAQPGNDAHVKATPTKPIAAQGGSQPLCHSGLRLFFDIAAGWWGL